MKAPFPLQKPVLTKLSVLLSVLFLGISVPSYAQKFRFPISNHLSVGGNIGISGGNTSYDINLSPVLSYRITSWVSVGVSPSYQYRHFKKTTQEIHAISGRIFVHAHPIRQLSLQAEYEYSYHKYSHGLPSRSIHNILLGGGIRQKITNQTYATASILWYLLPNEHTPINNPVYRAGVNYLF